MHCSPGNPLRAKQVICTLRFCLYILHWLITCKCMHSPRLGNHSSGFSEEKERIIITPPLPSPASPHLLAYCQQISIHHCWFCWNLLWNVTAWIDVIQCHFYQGFTVQYRVFREVTAGCWCPWLPLTCTAERTLIQRMIFFFRLYWVGTDFDSQFQSRIIKLLHI